MTDFVDIEVCAGPGGWDEGLRHLDVHPIGVEFARDATATARAAGHLRVLADMAAVDPLALTERSVVARICNGSHLDAPVGPKGETDGAHASLRATTPRDHRLPVRLFIGSPPCQGFSTIGKGRGRQDAELLIRAIADLDRPERFPAGLAYLDDKMADHRSILVLEPLRYIVTLRPEYVALEQVPSVLPIWEAYADVMRGLGYHVVTGIVNAEQYGVPQTRARAVLLASRTKVVRFPEPTHSRYHARTPQRVDEGVDKWVSMAEALGWGTGDRVGFPRLADNGDVVEIGGKSYRARDLRPASRPAFAVTGKSRSWVRFPEPTPELRDAVRAEVEPRVNNQSGTAFDLSWPPDRPALTVAGRDIVMMPGANANRFNGATKSRNDGIRVTLAEAGALQTFPLEYPWQGSKTSGHQQAGDAVPPLMAYHLVKELLS